MIIRIATVFDWKSHALELLHGESHIYYHTQQLAERIGWSSYLVHCNAELNQYSIPGTYRYEQYSNGSKGAADSCTGLWLCLEDHDSLTKYEVLGCRRVLQNGSILTSSELFQDRSVTGRGYA